MVQSYAIPLLLQPRDVVGIAPTGSGKTVAFAIPALASIRPSNERPVGAASPSVLVLCPTRELVQQTKSVFMKLSSGAAKTRAVFGGQDREEQRGYLHQGVDVLVATPGRLCDFLDSKDLSLQQIQFLVLDEADRMLEMGFSPQLQHIMSHMPKDTKVSPRTTMLWSATWSPTVEKLGSQLLRTEGRLTIEVHRDQKTNHDIQHCLYAMEDVSERIAKVTALYQQEVLKPQEKVLIFANNQETTEQVASTLRGALDVRDDKKIQALHGGMRQPRRDAIMRGYRDDTVRVLVATDVAARGLDVPDVRHVVNFDLPNDVDSFVHRVGRTGRAGRKGMAHSFFTYGGQGAICDIADFLKSSGTSIPADVGSVVQRSRGIDFRRYNKFSTGPVASPWESSHEVSTNWKTGRTMAPPPLRNKRPIFTLKRPTESPQ